MWFVGALDVIFRLIAAWKLFDHQKNITERLKPTDSRLDDNNVSDLEFVGRHRFIAFAGG
jgi:hypothetical protein